MAWRIETLAESKVTRDLFGGRVLVERSAFLAAQTEALEARRVALLDDGWAEAILGVREDVQDRLRSMDTPTGEPADAETHTRLSELRSEAERLEAVLYGNTSPEQAADPDAPTDSS